MTRVPPVFELPATVTLDDALRIFRTRGLDLLIADAAIADAQGQLQQASGIANPNVAVSGGPFFNYSARPPCSGCTSQVTSWSFGDNGAVADFLAGKRGLRIEIARATLMMAKLARADAQRNLEAMLKQQYVQVVLARQTLGFNKELQAALVRTLEINKLRYPQVIDEGALARIEVQKLEADQAVASSVEAVEQARMGLAYLLGVRTRVPEFDVDKSALDFKVPAALASATDESLVRRALEHRPDVRAAAYARGGADASVRLAQRNVFPIVSTNMTFTALGYGQQVPTAPVLTVGVSVDAPLFYQQQGEIRRAQAALARAALTHAKTAAQVASDVHTAFAGVVGSRKLVERMESVLLARAKKARDIVTVQFQAGQITLTDLLDAQRTYIATNVEYLTDLAAYWSAIFQLEQAVGEELRT